MHDITGVVPMASKIDALYLALNRAIKSNNKAEQRRIIIRLKEANMQVKSHCTGQAHKLNRDEMERQGKHRVVSHRSVKMPLGWGGHAKYGR